MLYIKGSGNRAAPEARSNRQNYPVFKKGLPIFEGTLGDGPPAPVNPRLQSLTGLSPKQWRTAALQSLAVDQHTPLCARQVATCAFSE
jgi:hypothetical protein